MNKSIEIKKKLTESWFGFLQNEICKLFESLENETSFKSKKFIKRVWKKENSDEGGGISYLLQNGRIFDKVGVNKSTVSGVFKTNFRKKNSWSGKKW